MALAFALVLLSCGGPHADTVARDAEGTGVSVERLREAVANGDLEGYEAILSEADHLGDPCEEVVRHVESELERELSLGIVWPTPPGLPPAAPVLARLGKPGVLALLHAYEPILSHEAQRLFSAPSFVGPDGEGSEAFQFDRLGWDTAEALLGLMRSRETGAGIRLGAGEVLSNCSTSVRAESIAPLLDMLDTDRASRGAPMEIGSTDAAAYWTLCRIVPGQPGTTLAAILSTLEGDRQQAFVWLIKSCGPARRSGVPVDAHLRGELRRCLEARSEMTRIGAASVLVDAGEADESIERTLQEALQHGAPLAQLWAAADLVRLGGCNEELLAVLLRGLQTDDWGPTAENLLRRTVASVVDARSVLERMVARDPQWRGIALEVLRLLEER